MSRIYAPLCPSCVTLLRETLHIENTPKRANERCPWCERNKAGSVYLVSTDERARRTVFDDAARS